MTIELKSIYTFITLYIYIMHYEFILWSSGQSSWLQIQRPRVDSRHYQIFWEVVSLELGPLSLVSTTEGLLERKSRGCGLETREYGRRDPSRIPRGTIYQQNVGSNFADKRRSLGRYSSLADSCQWVCFFVLMYAVLAICCPIANLLDDCNARNSVTQDGGQYAERELINVSSRDHE
jgi:hypothetical protein